MHEILTPRWFDYLNQFSRLIVGFSGGLDSTVLLHALTAVPVLRSKLVAVHINHGINPQASAWELHCQQFCLRFNIDFTSKAVHFDRTANIEERARKARYEVFYSLLNKEDCLVLGHHQDDQAETVLLQLLRGAGIDGMAAMSEFSPLETGVLVRPFLKHSREQLANYAALHQLVWVEDVSNEDLHYSRNYLRHQVLPLLVEKWPGAIANIARTAAHSQQAKLNLEALALNDYPEIAVAKNSLFIEPLLCFPEERIVNILRVWIKKNSILLPSTTTFYRLIHELLMARADAVPEVGWGNILVRRYQNYLYLDNRKIADLPAQIEWSNFPSPLIIEEMGRRLIAKKVSQGLVIHPGARLSIRFRQGGESLLLRGQHKQLKKLFQEWGIPTWLRAQIPLLYVDGELAAVAGYAVNDLFFKDCSRAWSLAYQ